LRIYNMRFCPYGQRALLAAAAKEIPYDVVNVSLVSKPEWLLERNPAGKVPTIDTPKGPLYESLIVAEYLDEAYPNHRKLVPSDPYQKALDKIWIENTSKMTVTYYKLISAYKTTDEPAIVALLKELQDVTAPLEVELKRRGTPFFSGSEPGLLDYAIWPWFERLPVLKLTFPGLYDFETAKTRNPSLEKWRKLMKEDKAVVECYVTPEVHHEFMMSHFAGSPKYDLLS